MKSSQNQNNRVIQGVRILLLYIILHLQGFESTIHAYFIFHTMRLNSSTNLKRRIRVASLEFNKPIVEEKLT